MARHQCGISALVSQTSFDRETSGSVAECRLFSQAIIFGALLIVYFSSLVVQTFHANKKYHEKESKGKIERILRCRYVIRSNYGFAWHVQLLTGVGFHIVESRLYNIDYRLTSVLIVCPFRNQPFHICNRSKHKNITEFEIFKFKLWYSPFTHCPWYNLFPVHP